MKTDSQWPAGLPRQVPIVIPCEFGDGGTILANPLVTRKSSTDDRESCSAAYACLELKPQFIPPGEAGVGD